MSSEDKKIHDYDYQSTKNVNYYQEIPIKRRISAEKVCLKFVHRLTDSADET